MNVLEYDSTEFVKLLEATITEFVTETEGSIGNIMLHLPKSWEDSEQVDIKGVPFIFTTENTLEIEVLWTDEKTKTEVNFIGVRMRAPQ